MAKKIEIAKNLGDWLYDFDNSLDIIIDRLKLIPSKYPKYHRFYFSVDQGYGDAPTCIELFGYRWETDAEYDERMLIAKSLKESKAREKTKKEGLERAEYERLKNKFKGK